jgi:hypothetical protein
MNANSISIPAANELKYEGFLSSDWTTPDSSAGEIAICGGQLFAVDAMLAQPLNIQN